MDSTAPKRSYFRKTHIYVQKINALAERDVYVRQWHTRGGAMKMMVEKWVAYIESLRSTAVTASLSTIWTHTLSLRKACPITCAANDNPLPLTPLGVSRSQWD
ncbi:hypothetical protein TNCV_554801 [Trichonephila clavipes]|nr:hypothetical protein TNCV_554801 [Trichonephila clavipes]